MMMMMMIKQLSVLNLVPKKCTGIVQRVEVSQKWASVVL